MCQTSEYVMLRLLSYYNSNVKIAKAVRDLFNVEGIKIDRKPLDKYYRRFKRDLPLGDLPRSGRLPTLQRRHFDFIDQKLEQNDELTPVGT